MDGSARDVSYTQVERHMRLCIAETVGLEEMITTTGSEPLLAEAAYELMKNTEKSAVGYLAEHSDLNCIDRGRRGELVAILLIMQAYDAAREISRKRWVSVTNFMQALLPPSSHTTLLGPEPTSRPIGIDTTETFEEGFKDYGLWFNHVIKIEDKEIISIDHLWKFVTRGAMILCATGQEGIDIVLPVHRTTQNLGPDSVTAIVVQVKNAKDYNGTPKPSLFDEMDSFVKSTIFSRVESDSQQKPNTPAQAKPPKKKQRVSQPKMVDVDLKPVIRLVFALASPEPAVIFRTQPEKRHCSDSDASDIWLAGVSCETFGQIQEEDLQSYQTLLERSLLPHDAFNLADEPKTGKEARKARGPRRRRMAPLIFPEPGHDGIHLPGPKELGQGDS